MENKLTSEPSGSRDSESSRFPVDAVAVGRTPSRGRRNPASILLARLLSALRGDIYLFGANPPGRER